MSMWALVYSDRELLCVEGGLAGAVGIGRDAQQVQRTGRVVQIYQWLIGVRGVP